MGFEIDVGNDAQVEIICDEFEVEIPQHFICLNSAEINSIPHNEKPGARIIGCGRCSDGNIDLLTNDGKLLTLSAQKYNIPPGYVRPILNGSRLSIGDTHTVLSSWVIDHAEYLIHT